LAEHRGCLPNLLVLGAVNAGTTSLYHYLRFHPEIHMSTPKELRFFADDWNWGRGVDWYASHFDPSYAVNGEVSPLYTTFPESPELMQRIGRLVPDAKLIYLVRDPIERMISHYVMWLSAHREDRTVEPALLDEGRNLYLATSRYWMQISRYLEYFDPARILIVQSERLRHDRLATLRRIFRFLGVAPDFKTVRFRIKRHSTRRKRRKTRLGRWLAGSRLVREFRRVPAHIRWPIEDLLFYPVSRRIPRPIVGEAVRAELGARLEDDIAQLRAFFALDLADWSVGR
jgi:hypothetical protein